MPRSTVQALVFAVLGALPAFGALAGCGGDGSPSGTIDAAAPPIDAPAPPPPDAQPPGIDATVLVGECDHRAIVPLDAARPVEIMPRSRLSAVIDRFPCVIEPTLVDILESPDTMWYDHQAIVPAYQDSSGPVGGQPMGVRPNTIDPSMIDVATPGGHDLVFADRGDFHFPFGRPTGVPDGESAVVDFWHVPRRSGSILPVVWWMREPNANTHRLEWLFPAGTVFGEVLFIVDTDGVWYPFEIRIRTRIPEKWVVEIFRPFPSNEHLAKAIEDARPLRPEWMAQTELDDYLVYLRDSTTLVPGLLEADHFPGAMDPITGARDVLPPLTDSSILRYLLLNTPYRSTLAIAWKYYGGDLYTWAPTTDARFSTVPRHYNGTFFNTTDEVCSTCHRDAGRPFRDFYIELATHGEVWGQDETFSWHPFDNASFVDASGDVVNFTTDNRVLRSDFLSANLLAPYDPAVHLPDTYLEIPRLWKGYLY
jgi:hypothetical protein